MPGKARLRYAARVELLAGRYETLGAVASGGMATVHLGRAVAMGGFERFVAIKLMHPHLAEDPDFVAMFLDEARLAARVRHPNVVATLDVQQSDEGLFLVMEFVEGCSLTAIMRKLGATGTKLPVNIAGRVMIDALAGLHAAHELRGSDGHPLQLVHRDVSPANILVGADGVARLTDFGVARAEERISSTRGGELKGKVPYMPPEQLRAEPTDRRVDVYAAGVVLWEALVGRRLFRAPNEAALLGMILDGVQSSPRELRADVPTGVAQACMRALARNPAERFPTAAAFADELEHAAVRSGLGVASTRTVSKFVGGLDVARTVEEVLAKHRERAAARAGVSPGGAALEQPPESARSPAPAARARAAGPPPSGQSGSGAALAVPSAPSSIGTAPAGALAAEPALARRPTHGRRWWLAVLGAAAGTGVAAGFAVFVWMATLGPAAGGPPDLAADGSASAESVLPTQSSAGGSTRAGDAGLAGAAGAPGAASGVAGAGPAPAVTRSGAPARPSVSQPVTRPTGPPPRWTEPPAAPTSPSARQSPTSFRPTTL